jgi:hypothetical protein
MVKPCRYGLVRFNHKNAAGSCGEGVRGPASVQFVSTSAFLFRLWLTPDCRVGAHQQRGIVFENSFRRFAAGPMP